MIIPSRQDSIKLPDGTFAAPGQAPGPKASLSPRQAWDPKQTKSFAFCLEIGYNASELSVDDRPRTGKWQLEGELAGMVQTCLDGACTAEGAEPISNTAVGLRRTGTQHPLRAPCEMQGLYSFRPS